MDESLKPTALSLAEILSSLSYALDLTGGQPMGHAQRSCLIGMRIGSLYGLSENELTSLYYAVLMKDAGCSSNAARMYEIFGSDDLKAKGDASVVDWSNIFEAARYAAAHALPSGSLCMRAARVLKIGVQGSRQNQEIQESRCNRGSQIAMMLGLGKQAADCIRSLPERWNGSGAPQGLCGEAIPLLSRIASLAQTIDVFDRTFGLDAAYEMAEKRSGRWFDPELVRIAQRFRNDLNFWHEVRNSARETLLDLDIRAAIEMATESRIDSICDAFAQIVDAKSPFTGQHSSRVRDYSVQIARGLGISGARLTTMRRAALLHDVGKLAVPNTILDKPGKPDEEEWKCIRLHPFHTQQILHQIPGFERITQIASAHHERLDGRGYFQGLNADQLDLDMRILAVADVYDALSAERPYRGALPQEEVFAILDKDRGIALDADCIDVLKKYAMPAEPTVLRRAA
ncbi:metal-dependent phosphohydrolase [Capsulimonas corticalis]|uniref:Metal-dependent phosphohydrolase n=1 Tax=Capsulimonas corticalis TaxID=2219043 RepID=A0A402CTP8_9BACT|nr:HD domain-containing phosphohydrolase [Capsulimonas corticalis]BDI30669.1 metal-dependent phosphohydrolase [Capsulimonas corticalis]